MTYHYKTKNTCSTEITFDINNGIVSNISFKGGCNGNLQAIPRLVDGWSAEQIDEKLNGIKCGRRPTSCPDQLAHAVMEAYEKEKSLVNS